MLLLHGSLLGLYYKEVSSYPVGYERVIDLHPLDFEEFLWGIGMSKEIIKYASDSFLNKKTMEENILNQLNKQFKMYILVGGMPRIVEEYVLNKSLANVLKMQKAIIENYLLDVMKFAEKSKKQKIINTFNSIPAQLAKTNKKFIYSDVDKTR
jgi:predicted AAA+ superfamily ATPase